MNNFSDIKVRFEVSKKILLDCELIYHDIKTLRNIYNGILPSEYQKTIENSSHFIRFYEMSWHLLIIKLLILFTEKEDYSLKKSLNSLLTKYEKSDWKSKIEKSIIEELIERHDNNLIKNTLIDLKHLRDKFIAHLDINRDKKISVYFEQIKTLMELGEFIINTIYQKIEGYQEDFNPLSIEDVENVLYKLVDYNKRQ